MVNMVVYICQNLANITLKICAFYCMHNKIKINKKLQVVAFWRIEGKGTGNWFFSLKKLKKPYALIHLGKKKI